MAYTPREIKDRVAVGDDIFIVEDLGNNRIRLIPAPTHVSEPGTPINKALLQPMEDHRFSDEHDVRYYTKSQLNPVIHYLTLNHWVSCYSNTSTDLWGIAYGDGLWVVVGYNGTILTSPNGTTWTSVTGNTSSDLLGVTYANDLWVAVGYDGTILTSPNGTTWTPRASSTTSYLLGVTYANDLWVAVGYDGTIVTAQVITL